MEREIWIYILIEHQSDRDEAMGLRLLIYIVQLWETQRSEYLQKKIPVSQWRLRPVVPILFYTGQRRWTPDLSVASLMDLPPSLEEFTPRFRALYLPLKQTPAERLTIENHPLGWVLRAMRAEDAPLERMSAELKATVEWLEQLPNDEYAAWQEAMHFLGMLIQHRRPSSEHEHLRQVMEKSIRNRQHKQEVRKMAKTMAEFLMEQGEARGLEKGEVLGMIKAKQDAVLRLMRLKFGDLPPQFAQRVQAIRNVERLDALLEQVWNANSLKGIRWRTPSKSE